MPERVAPDLILTRSLDALRGAPVEERCFAFPSGSPIGPCGPVFETPGGRPGGQYGFAVTAAVVNTPDVMPTGAASARLDVAELVFGVSAVPEPSTAGLCAVGGLLLGAGVRCRARRARERSAPPTI